MRKRKRSMCRIYELLICNSTVCLRQNAGFPAAVGQRRWEYKVSDIKIFVTHTPNQETMRVGHPLLYDVIAGSDFQTEKVPDGMLLDNQGENISSKNKSYCELTTQYWAWKNRKADYYGFCHYRRFFSFHHGQLNESAWGTIEYEYLNELVMQELHLNEADMRSQIETYDFLIAKGVPVKCMNAKSVYDHYQKAPELHIQDLELFLDILTEKYPQLRESAIELLEGKVFYPCNMFIMNRKLFCEYCEILFDVLEEFEKRADMRTYSREGYRTIGHLGERMTGIYYLYLQKHSTYRLGERQIAFIHNAQAQTEVKAPAYDAVPVVLAANEAYVPILYTCVQSIADCAAQENNYEIYVFHTDISSSSQAMFQQRLVRENINITFVNVASRVSGYVLQAKQHISTETFYRFLILDILKDYEKVVYLDADMIVLRDVAELYHTQMGEHLIAAAVDPDFAGQCNMKNSEMRQYCKNTLGLENPFQYFQAGVLVFHVAQMRREITVEKLLEMADTDIYRFSDQDILNIVCKDRVIYLDMSWNMIFDCNRFRWKHVIKYAPHDILDAYENARRDPYIIHYAGFLKPWMKPDEDFGYIFWETARHTPYYEQLLSKIQKEQEVTPAVQVRAFKRTRLLFMKILKPGSRMRVKLGKLYWGLFG